MWLPCAVLGWSGDTWGSITRATIKANADQMIDSTWVPKNTFTNFQYGSTYRTYYQGTTYMGVAYSQNNPQENWVEFRNAVTNTSGGSVGYGNDCSGFVSICWKLPARKTTYYFESQLGTYWTSLGDIGSGATAPLVMGDALNSASDHIVLFLNRETTGVRTMEQTPNNAQRKVRSYSFLQTYRPIRRLQILEDRGISLSGDLAFGSVAVGASAQRVLTIHSTGTSPLYVTNLTCPARFSGNWSGTIPAGASTNVTITFSPNALATYNGSITVSSDATVGTNTRVVSGTGVSLAPQMTSQPQDLTVAVGQVAFFSVTAAGMEPLSYQWRFNGANLGDETAAQLLLGNVQSNQAGGYSVVVTNTHGAVTSRIATLTVVPGCVPGGSGVLWSLAPGSRPYLTVNSLPYERGMAYNPVTHRLLVVRRSGPHVYVLNADTGADLHELNVSGVTGGISSDYYLLMVGVADDGVVYAGNLTTAGATTAFKLYRWANDSPATVPSVAYSGDPGAGNSQRWGDTLDVRGAGTNTQIILASRSGNVVAVLTTANGTTFTSKLITVADAPAGAFGLGIAFGTGNTFWGKATSQALRQVSFDLAAGTGASQRVYADPSFPNSVAPIGVNALLNLLAGISVGTAGNQLQLYDLTPLDGGPALIATNNFATDNDNTGTGTGAVDFGYDRVYALGANNGLLALQVICVPQFPTNGPPAEPGHFDSIGRLADGAVQLSMSGTAGTNYILQWTRDWAAWSNLCTLSSTNGSFWWVDSSATNASQRFYRLSLDP